MSVWVTPTLSSQILSTESYEGELYPDLWYNQTDGIRLGIRFEGRVPGMDEEGPHRLDAGFWIGTWLPDHPFSYRVHYTEPIPAISTYGNEGSVRLQSSIREGYHRHEAGLHKRWQKPFDSRHYWEGSLTFGLERRYDDQYLLFPELWSDEWKGLLRLTADHNRQNRAGLFQLSVLTHTRIAKSPFTSAELSVVQVFEIWREWQLKSRLFLGMASRNTLPEYRYLLSTGTPVSRLESPLTRSKGTIPVAWAESGFFQASGGANLRGYTEREVRSLRAGEQTLYRSLAALNFEMDLPNPVNRQIRNSDLLASILSFRTYLFSDTGFSPGLTENEPDTRYSSAGAGVALSLNVPDYLHKPRGFVIRYEIPFWLSEPLDKPAFAYRYLFGIGAVISL